jgi:putative N6-adenine-specific DNA methylase
MYNCYLTCPRGLEHLAQDEISHYADSITVSNGGINFQVDKKGLYQINLSSRIGMHLLVELFSFEANDDHDMYNQIYNFPWHDYIDIKQTFIIRMRGSSDKFGNKNYTTLKIKDAIVDQIKKKKLTRPSIAKENPDITISVFITDNQFKIYSDSSGISLHKRGYRNKIHKAALNESLAAGLVMLSGWNRSDSFYDTMCGSGTIAIEAALLAYNIAPGLLRKDFAFQKWSDYDEELFLKIKNKLESDINLDKKIKIHGYDSEFSNIVMAMYSSKLLGLEKYISFKKQNMLDFKPDDSKATLIINPPYGERLGDDDSTKLLYQMIGDIFKHKCTGFDCYVFTANLEAAKSIGLKTNQKIVLKNGSLDSRLLHYPIQEGIYNKKGSN